MKAHRGSNKDSAVGKLRIVADLFGPARDCREPRYTTQQNTEPMTRVAADLRKPAILKAACDERRFVPIFSK